MKKKQQSGARAHKMGKDTFYETDGVHIWPARTFTEPMDRLFEEQEAIAQLLLQMNAYYTKALTNVRRRIGGQLDAMAQEFGLTRGEFYYNFNERRICPYEKPREGKEAVDLKRPQADDQARS